MVSAQQHASVLKNIIRSYYVISIISQLHLFPFFVKLCLTFLPIPTAIVYAVYETKQRTQVAEKEITPTLNCPALNRNFGGIQTVTLNVK